MKRFILSLVNLILAGAMLLILICPIASFNKVVGDAELKEGQNASSLYFVESLFVSEEDVLKASADLIAKSTELALEFSGDEFDEKLRNSPEKNRYDVYQFATSETLIAHGFTSDSGNLIVQTKAVSALIIVYLVCAALTVLITLICMIFNSKKLKGLGTFFTLIAFLISVALALTIEFALKLDGAITSLVSHVKWPLYVFIGFTFIYMLIRSALNRKTN